MRVAVLIDRAPACPDWKGAGAWALINALAESQHELQVFTTLDPTEVGETHARVGVARPAPSFGLTHLAAWARALVGYRPDVIHTFAPRRTDEWGARYPKLSCWPYLDALAPLLNRAGRVATLFDADDLPSAAAPWLRSHKRWTTFDPTLALGAEFAGEISVSGPAGLLPAPAAAAPDDFDDGEILVPAPVAEWRDRAASLAALGVFLREDPSRRVRIVGGWGDLGLGERRAAWETLADFTSRVHLGPALSLSQFVRDSAHARGTWAESLRRGSWRAGVAGLLAGDAPPASDVDVVNQLSRIYSAAGRW